MVILESPFIIYFWQLAQAPLHLFLQWSAQSIWPLLANQPENKQNTKKAKEKDLLIDQDTSFLPAKAVLIVFWSNPHK